MIQIYGKSDDGSWMIDWVFQQDGATCHTARVSREWIRDHFPNFIDKEEWPPKSPDLTVPDYYGWGRLKEIVNVEAFRSVADLKRALQEAWDELGQHEISVSADHQFRSALTRALTAYSFLVNSFVHTSYYFILYIAIYIYSFYHSRSISVVDYERNHSITLSLIVPFGTRFTPLYIRGHC